MIMDLLSSSDCDVTIMIDKQKVENRKNAIKKKLTYMTDAKAKRSGEKHL